MLVANTNIGRKYWKIDDNNVTSVALSDLTHDASINAICISGDDIFLKGYEKDDSGIRVAKYWRAYNGMSFAVTFESVLTWGEQNAQGDVFV